MSVGFIAKFRGISPKVSPHTAAVMVVSMDQFVDLGDELMIVGFDIDVDLSIGEFL